MESIVRLFRALPVKDKTKRRVSPYLLSKTIPNGFLLSEEVQANYSDEELLVIIDQINNIIGSDGKKANSSFHKSWQKVQEADIKQLILEQAIHYFTTYGMERLGLYQEVFVYIPAEELHIPELDENIELLLIRGYTKEELKQKLMELLSSGIALHEDTIKDIMVAIDYVGFVPEDIYRVKNKEVKIGLYDKLGIPPKEPVEFLRYIIYKTTGKTLLIKDKETFKALKESDFTIPCKLLTEYHKMYGLDLLASVFYRFKPIFLSIKNKDTSNLINKIRKLAPKYHRPMPVDYLNDITHRTKWGVVDIGRLQEELAKVNTFRKIRLAYALKYRMGDVDSILYKVRNGKSFAKAFEYKTKEDASEIYDIVLSCIADDIKKNVEGKRIYIPDNIIYSIPTTEKQYTGMFPSGTCVIIPKDMIFGVYWENVKLDGIKFKNTGLYEDLFPSRKGDTYRVDLDLSLINADVKYGWDGLYRDVGRDILFSGDMTDASNGASEFFYVKRQTPNCFLFMLNFFNYHEEIEVPIKIFVAQEEAVKLGATCMVDPNNIVATTDSKVNRKQKMLGLVTVEGQGSKFYFAETNIGKGITSSHKPYVEHSRRYLYNFYTNTPSLQEVLVKAGGIMSPQEECEIDLSPNKLEKDTILKLLY
jgi:hypothetical protein